jgi:hypothetical protein
MIFDVLKSTIHFSKWEGEDASLSLSFEIVPKNGEYLDLGDKHILCASGYLPMRDKDREPITATVSVSTNFKLIEHVKGDKPICGYANFFPGRQGTLESRPAELAISVVVEPYVFEGMLRAKIRKPGAATLHVGIEGLDFGWEPDGSHQIWKLDDDSDCQLGTRRRVTSFWFNVETFRTSERLIREEADRQTDAWLAESTRPGGSEATANLQPPEKPDRVSQLLRQCRTILLAIMALAVVALVTFNR